MFGCLLPSINVQAVSLSDINSYFSVQDKFYQILKRVTDISTTQEHQTSILNKMYDILEDGGYSGSRSGEGLSDSGDVTINTSGDILLSVDLQNAIRQATQDEIDNDMGFKYVYTFSGADWLDCFDNQDTYHSFLDVLSSNEGNICFVSCPYTVGSKATPSYIGVLLKTYNWVYSSNSTIHGTPVNRVDWYDGWETTSYSTSLLKNYYLNSSTGLYEEVENTNRDGTGLPLCRQYNNSQILSLTSNERILTTLNRSQFVMYLTFNDMKLGSEGLQPYYVGNDFSTSTVTTTQTITDSMLNSSISYSNIQDYVNSYYVTNQSYPTTNNVYNYINNYNGGSGSGGSGSGGSDNPSWDFSFLSTIGQFIASLIAGIGEVIGGILEALTSIISSLREGFPNVIGSLLEYFVPFLPDEIVTLISLSILFAILVGIIKLIRG